MVLENEEVVELFQKLFSEYIRHPANVKRIALYKRKISVMASKVPEAKSISVEMNGSVSIGEVKRDTRRVIRSFSGIFDALVEVSSFTIEPTEAKKTAAEIIRQVLKDHGALVKRWGIDDILLKGALTQKANIGIRGFDNLLRGGIPRGSSVILQGPPGATKSLMAYQFLKEGLLNGEKILVALSNSSVEDFRNRMRILGVDVLQYEKRGMVRIVDWYSHKQQKITGVAEEGSIMKSSIDLTNLAVAVNNSLKKLGPAAPKRAALDVISSALVMYDPNKVYSVLQTLKARLRKMNTTSLFIIEKSSHDRAVLSTLHQTSDGIIDIETRRINKQMAKRVGILSMRGASFDPDYYFIKTTKKGIVVLEDARELTAPASPTPTAPGKEKKAEKVPPAKKKKSPLDECDSLYAAKRYEEALECVDKFLEKNPGSEEAWETKCWTLYRLDKVPESLACASDVLKSDPDFRRVWYALGKVLYLQERYDAALRTFSKAANLSPEDDRILAGKGKTLFQVRKVDEAFVTISKALRINNRQAEAWTGLGLVLFVQGKYGEALKSYDKAISLNREDFEAWTYKGMALKELDLPEEALSCFDKALEINPIYDLALRCREECRKALAK